MYWALIVLHVIVCTFLVLVVLLQAGKGGGIGIAFGGGGGSQTVFGSSGAGNFLTRMTAICATIFFLNSLGLAWVSSRSDSTRLQRLAEQKAATKKNEDAAKSKVIEDVEKAREALKRTEADKAQAPGTAPAPAGSAEAAKTAAPTAPAAPTTTPSPTGATGPKPAPKSAAPAEKAPPK
jgi:preprotein translocase subunit SecG